MSTFTFWLAVEAYILRAASRSAMPKIVFERGIEVMKRKVVTPGASLLEGLERWRARERAVGVLNAPNGSDDFAFTPSCSYAISAAANAVAIERIESGDVILVLDDQMSSSVYPWQHLAKQTGARVEILSVDGPHTDDPTEAIVQAVAKSAIVAIPQVHWCDGTVYDRASESMSQATSSSSSTRRRVWERFPSTSLSCNLILSPRPVTSGFLDPTVFVCSTSTRNGTKRRTRSISRAQSTGRGRVRVSR